jgi:HSP20 family protein
MNRSITRFPARSLWGQMPTGFDRVFDGFFSPLRDVEETVESNLYPAVDISETENEYLVRAELPGINKEDVKVTLENGILTLSAETRSESEQREGERVIRQERQYGKYVRSLRLGKGINDQKVSANYKNGVLEIVVPKAEEVKPKVIDVNVQ